MLDLALLGHPFVRVDGAVVAVPTRKALALVAHLALEGPSQRARLAAGLWPSIDREKARSNLRRELNRLRQTALGDLIVSEGSTIGLAEPFVCDVREFVKKCDEQDFRAALELYRGTLLDGLELYESDELDDWLTRRRASLAERQRAMLALEASFRDQSGDPRGALVRYLDLIRLDPTEESHHRAAMRLHYRVGEREAALERFAELKRVLRRELALEPSVETVELYRVIRSASPLPERPDDARNAWPFVGRTHELSRIEGSARPCVLVLGDPGVGKTRLVTSCSHSSTAVLEASEASHGTPFSPVTSALRAAWAQPSRRVHLAGLPRIWRREVARLLPELDPEARFGLLDAEAHPRLLEGLARALAVAAQPESVLVLEDLHWFDAASVEVAFHVCQRASALGLRIVATARPLELPASAAQGLVDALTRAGLCEVVELEPLSEEEVLALLRAVHPERASVEFARRLQRATAGNPTYLLQMLKTVEEHRSATELAVPSEVRDAVLSQLEKRGPKLRRLLEAASLSGNRFSLDELGGESGLDAFEAVDALDEAIRAGFVVRDGGGTRFHHELVRRALADGRRTSH